MAFSCQSPKSPPRVSFGWTGPASIRGLYLALLLSLLWQDCCLPANWCYLLQPQYFYDATDPSSGELICDWGKLECCRIGCHVLSLSAGDGFWWPFKLIFNNLGQSQKHTQIPICGVLLKEHRNMNTAHDNWQHLTLLVPVSAVLTWNTSNVNCDWKPSGPDQKHHRTWVTLAGCVVIHWLRMHPTICIVINIPFKMKKKLWSKTSSSCIATVINSLYMSKLLLVL